MKIEIYSKELCGYCLMAERLAQEIIDNYPNQDNSYIKLTLDEDYTREQLLEKFPGAKTFPQITIDGITIGGYNQFYEYLYG